MPAVTEILSRWNEERSRYVAYAEAIEPEIRETLLAARAPYEIVTSRVKEPHSLATKVLRKGYSAYADISDKVGVRVVVRLQSEVDRAVAAITGSSYTILRTEDNRTRVDVDQFDYRSVHIQVGGTRQDATFADLECEIQIRTVSENAWSIMSHFLSYKSVKETTYLHRRSIAALAALFEIADTRYEELFLKMSQASDYPAMSVLADIEGTFLSLGGDVFDRTLSRDVIEFLLQAYTDPSTVSERVNSWAESNRAWLAERFQRYRDDRSGSVFMGQPEALLIGELPSSNSIPLLRLWSETYEVEELELIAAAFGYTVRGLEV